jgi:hypothetical protein
MLVALLYIITGAGIRILLISNIEGATDELTESIDVGSTTIVSKEVGGNAKELARTGATLFANGKYDVIVAVTDNAVGANVSFSQYEGIAAAVCHDVEEARDAKAQGVNTIIIRYGFAHTEEIVSAFLKGGGLRMNVRMPVARKPQTRRQEEGVEEEEQRLPVKMRHEAEKLTREYEEEPQLPKRPGFKGWIKDSLGIIDVEKPKHNKKKGKGRDDTDGDGVQ